MSMELHPLSSLFPRMSGAEFDALVADIKTNGLRQPIVLHGGMILDGGNRYRACMEAGVEPVFDEFEGDSIVSFVLSANLHRRHMTPGQQAAIVASAQDWAKAQKAGSNQHLAKAGPARLPDQLATVSQRAAESGVSERTQRMADKVAKADPALAKQVAQGEVTLPEAVEKLTGKRPGSKNPEKEQSEVERLRSRVAELESELEECRGNMAVMADELAAYKREADPDSATKFVQQQGYITTLETQRDDWMMQCSRLKKEVKALQKRLGA